MAAKKSVKSFRGPQSGKFSDVDKEVLVWVQETRNNGYSVSHEMLQIKAREIAKNKGIDGNEFKASRGWAVRFMRRNNLSLRMRTSLCQRLPEEYTHKVIKFQQFVLRQRQEHQFLLSQIGNADQTPVYFDMPRRSTINTKGASSVLVKTTGAEQLRCTVMLAVTADGNKLPPYVIFKRKTMPKGNFPKGMIIRVQEKGWMVADLMLDWLDTVWGRRPGALLKKKAMLVLDSFRGHLVNAVSNKMRRMNTYPAIIPGGLTSILQPLDVSVNKPFKDNMRRFYVDWMASDNHALTKGGKIKKPSIETVCEWIVRSWELITPQIVKRSFKKTGISCALDGSEDDALWETNDSEGEDDGDGSGSDGDYDDSVYE